MKDRAEAQYAMVSVPSSTTKESYDEYSAYI